jgi:hypothetical protein
VVTFLDWSVLFFFCTNVKMRKEAKHAKPKKGMLLSITLAVVWSLVSILMSHSKKLHSYLPSEEIVQTAASKATTSMATPVTISPTANFFSNVESISFGLTDKNDESSSLSSTFSLTIFDRLVHFPITWLDWLAQR